MNSSIVRSLFNSTLPSKCNLKLRGISFGTCELAEIIIRNSIVTYSSFQLEIIETFLTGENISWLIFNRRNLASNLTNRDTRQTSSLLHILLKKRLYSLFTRLERSNIVETNIFQRRDNTIVAAHRLRASRVETMHEDTWLARDFSHAWVYARARQSK